MKDKVPEMEYVFTDTGKELPETYEFLDKLEAFLGKPVVRLNPERGFDHWLKIYGGYLPSSRMRWCTRQLKLRPFEKYVGDQPVVSYVGIRADEDREGYISTKPNITAKFPFKEAGITHADVMRILEEAGLGLPEYYKWRSRSGCYFCFFQQKGEWAGLLKEHPELFASAESYEKEDPQTGDKFTWRQGESLNEIRQDTRLYTLGGRNGKPVDPRLSSVLEDSDADASDGACLICSL
jgi:3'-phosphoadenosine 5'-phosphosulfate sulfotransferase (PAPS reductase)/FAD synthetase